MGNRICLIDGCGRKHYGRGLCESHCRRLRLYGDPLGQPVTLERRSCNRPACGRPLKAKGLCAYHYTQLRRAEAAHCSVDGCESAAIARGWCARHYSRWQRWGDPLGRAPWVSIDPICEGEGCDQLWFARGLCRKHYFRQRRHGETNPRKRGEVRDGKKICAKCRRDLPLSEFTPRPDRPGQWHPRCSECTTRTQALSRMSDRDRWREYHASYREANRDKLRDFYRKQAALRRNPSIDVTTIELLAVLERDGWRCGICELRILRGRSWPDRLSPSLDHIIPVSVGGAHSYENIQAAHLGCNMSKGPRLIQDVTTISPSLAPSG